MNWYMNKKLIKQGFILAAGSNIFGVLLFSRAFTNTAINDADPIVMSNFGLLMIIVWGLAYLGASTINANVKWLAAAFVIEKLVYVLAWANWIASNSLSALYSKDLFAGVFFSIYGLNDFIFLLFFSWVFMYSQRDASNENNA